MIAILVLTQVNFAFADTAVNALPTGGQVVAGSATISQTQTATSAAMNINQTSQRAVVNWDSFNVGKNAQVNFNQPNAQAVTLNRVTSASASMIDGAIRANGQVVLVNPNGVTFGRGADINAAAVVATTMNIANKDFMDGKSTYKGNGKGAVINEGKISVNDPNGYIALLAPEIRNDGYLLARKGPNNGVALAAGEQITLDFRGDQLISVNVDKSTYGALIENKRVIEVKGGLIVVAAGSANQLMGSVIKNTGRISASSMVNNGGVIELVAANVTQAGIVSANGKGANTQGGQVHIVGEEITLAQNSKTTASGKAGGGNVEVGLGRTVATNTNQAAVQAIAQVAATANTNTNISTNKNTNTLSTEERETSTKQIAAVASQTKQMAKTVTVAENAIVNASAIQEGNAGNIVIWSEIKTTVSGILKAVGGALGGNGGFIETSSKGSVVLGKNVSVDTSASATPSATNTKGKSGLWLLDPIDLIIDSDASRIISAALSNNNVTIEVNGNVCPSLGSCTQNGSGSLTIASGADILKQGNTLTTLKLISSGIFDLNANIAGENLNVIISSSIAFLNVGTTISAREVTVQAQTIYANGNINASSNAINNLTNSNSLGGAIQLLAQALYVSGRLNINASSNVNTNSNNTNTNTNTNTNNNTVTYNGVVIREEDLPTFLTAQNNGSNNLDQVYSSTAANDANSANVTPIRAAQANSITLIANNQLHLYASAQLLANGTADVSMNGVSGAGGSIYLTAQTLTAESGSLIQANGNNGPGGTISITASNDANLAGAISANGTTGGSFALSAKTAQFDGPNTIQTNGSNGPGGTISIDVSDNISFINSGLRANGSTNGGSIRILSRAGNLSLFDSVIQTNGGNGRGGSITTSANNGSTSISSVLESIGATQGGNILITANHITLENNSRLIATGNTGGGNILVGGDWQGSNGIYQATTVTMKQGALIDASALIHGDGGKVVLWSDIKNMNSITEAHGSIYAKGGEFGGRGGNVETSAGLLNTEHIYVDTRAADGSAGSWLLDPYNYVFGVNGAADIVSLLASTNVTISTSAATSIRKDTEGNCATCGDMVISGAITYTGSDSRRLTLQASGYINVSANITSTNAALDVILWSDLGGVGGIAGGSGGYIYIAPGVTISTRGGKIILAGGADDGSNGGVPNDGIPDSYAWNKNTNTIAGIQLGALGGTGSSVNLYSGGGDVIMRGYTSGSSLYPGMATQKSFTIDSGVGTILIQAGSQTGHGFEWAYGVAADFFITSASTSSDAIRIYGSTTVAGFTGGIVALRTGNYIIQSTASTGGGILLSGINSAASGNPLFMSGAGGTAYILSKNGPITINGSGGNNGIVNEGAIKLGSSSAVTINGALSSVTSSSANITLTSNYFSFGASSAINTTGALTIEPFGTSFSGMQTLSNVSFGSTLSQVTLGKSGNTGGITISSGFTSAGTLTVNAGRLLVSSNISVAAAGNINVTAVNSSSVIALYLYSGSLLESTGGSLTITAGSVGSYDIYTTNATLRSYGDLTITANSSTNRTTYLDSSSLVRSTNGSVSITSTSTGEIALYLNASAQIIASGAITIVANSSTNQGLYTEASAKIESTGSTLDISALGGILIKSTSLLSQGNLSIYSNGTTNNFTGIDFNTGSSTIRSSAGNVLINAIGYHGIYLNDASTTIRAYGDLTISALAKTEIAMYGSASGTCSSSPCGLISDTGNVTINAISKDNSLYGYDAYYLRNPVIANGTAPGKGNVYISATGLYGGIYADGAAYGYVLANGNIDLIGYGGWVSGTYGIYIGAAGPSLNASSGGLLRAVSGNITLSAFGYGVGLYGNSTLTNIVALAGNVVVQGASLSTNSAGTFSAATNAAIISSYNSIYSSISTAANPGTFMPSGYSTGSSGTAATSFYWGVIWKGNIFAVNNPNTVALGTAPISGGTITISGSVLNAVSPTTVDTGAGIIIYDGGNFYSWGSLGINGYGIGGRTIADGVNASTGANHGVVIWGATSTLRSYNSSLTLAGYANGFKTSSNFTANLESAGVLIYSDANTIRGKTGVTITGIDLSGIGVYLASYTVGGNGITADAGEVTINGMNNNSTWYSTYIRQSITASSGTISVNAAGQHGLSFDDAQGVLTASGNININSYASLYHAFNLNTGVSNAIQSTGGNITISSTAAGSNTSYYALYEASTTSITANQNIIFQGSSLAAPTPGNIVSAATAATPVFPTANSGSVMVGPDATHTLSWAGAMTATNGYIALSGNSVVSGLMTASNVNGGLVLIGAGTYNLSNTSNNLSTVGASIGTSSLTLVNGSPLKIGTVNSIAGITAGALTLTAAGLTGSADITPSSSSSITINNASSSYDYSGIISGSTSLTKSGAGTQILSGANTYSGLTTISIGTLKLGNASALGTNAAGTSITSGAVLDLNGQNITTVEALTINGTGISSSGAVMNSSASAATYAGLITLGSASSIVGGTGTIAISNVGTITGATFGLTLGGAVGGSVTSIIGTTSGTLTKSDAGTWTLSGANTYSGLTTISIGTLKLGNASALGTNAAGTSITSGAVLDLNGQNITTVEALTINGTGISSSGAVMNSSASAATYAGLITLGSASSIVGGTGTIAISNVGTITGATFGLTLGGAVGGSVTSIIGTTSGTLTKSDAGTWTLSGANTYTGLTTISAGTLVAANSGALGTSAGGVTISSGATLALQGGITIADAITVGGNGVSSAGAILNNSGSNTISALVTLNAATTIGSTAGTLTFDVASGSAFTGTQNISFIGAGNMAVADPVATSTGTLTKSGNGTLTLSGANTYTGLTTISAGTIRAGSGNALGTGAVGIGSSGILDLAYNGTVTLGSTLNMTTGAAITNSANTSNLYVTSTATLSGNITTAGTQTYIGAVTLGSNATLTSSNADITFSSTVDGESSAVQSLTIANGSGNIIFTGNVGGTALSVIDLSANTGTVLLGQSITTSGSQNYGGSIYVVGSSSALNSSSGGITVLGTITSGGILQLTGTIDGSYVFNGASGTLTSKVLLGNFYVSFSGSTYTITPLISLSNISNIVVGGGGGGGATACACFNGGGGGGGGQVLSSNTLGLTAGVTYTIGVGAGGLGGTAATGAKGSGTTSISGPGLTTISSASGFGGGSQNTTPLAGAAGGSGGGAGGTGGWNGTNNNIVNGSNGTTSSISGASVTYGSGGGGGSGYTNNGGVAGIGGTGAGNGGFCTSNSGSCNSNGTDGITFGSGGGGAYGGSTPSTGGSGVSGVVILSPKAQDLIINAGSGAASVKSASSLTTLKIISSSISSGQSSTGVISGSTALIFDGSTGGILTLSGANTYSGGTTIKAGTIVGTSAAANAFGTSTITLGDITGSANASVLIGRTGLTYTNAIVLATGTTGTLTLGNTGTAISTIFTGGVTGANNLTINANATTGTITFNIGALNNIGTVSNIGTGTGTTTINSIIGSNVTGVVENSTTSNLILAGNNSYAGNTTISSGTLAVSVTGNLGSTANAINLNGGTLSITGSTVFSSARVINVLANSTISNADSGGITFTGNVTGPTSITAATLTITGANATTFSTGVIADGSGAALALTQNTTGTTTLSGTNTYTGATTISAGTLKAGSTTAFGGSAGAITVTDGASLDLGGQTLANTNALTLNGVGVSAVGALTNSSGTTGTYAGAITLGSISSIGSTTGAITVTGAISAGVSDYGLVLVGNRAYTLSSTSNALRAIASGSSIGALTIVNTGDLAIGTVVAGTPYNGLSSSGTISIRTTGDLTISQNVATTSTSSTPETPALLLAAGYDQSAGTVTKNIKLSGTPTFTVGTGGIIDFYSGDSDGSTGLTAYVDAKTPKSYTYSASLSTQPATAGYNVIYRGAPPYIYLTIVDSQTGTYGTASGLSYWYSTSPTLYGSAYLPSSLSSFNAAQIFTAGQSTITLSSGGLTGTINISTALTASTNAATYSMTLNPGTLALTGSSVTFVAGAAKNFINSPKALDITISKVYDGSNTFTSTNSYALIGMANSDTAPTISSGSATLANANVTTTAATAFTSNSFALSNANYTLTGGSVSVSISQLASVTYTGATGGSWSDGANWTVTGGVATGARPTLGNVATVVIPVTTSVSYGDSMAGLVPTSAVAITNNGLVSFANTSAITMPAAISGDGAVTFAGSAAVTLSNTNTYTGATTINSGATLKLGSATTISNSSAVVINGTLDLAGYSETVGSIAGASTGLITSTASGTLVLTAGGDNSSTRFAGVIQNGSATTVAITKVGTGTLTLSGTNTNTGVSNINGGTISVNVDANLGAASSVAINAGSLLIDGSGTFSSAKNFTLNGAATISNANTTNASTFSGNFTNSANLLTVSGSGNTTISGVIGSGSGGLTKDGSGILTLSNTNTYTGATTINSGATLKLGSATTISNSSAVVINGTLDLAGYSETVGSIAGASTGLITSTASGTLVLTAGGDNSSTRFAGVIQNGSATTVAITKVGTGTLTLSGTNTNTGVSNINGGTISVNVDANLGAASSVAINAGSLLIDGSGTFSSAKNFTLNGAATISNANTTNASTFSGNFTNSANLLTVSGSGNTTISGVIGSGSGGLTKDGSGILTLSNTNTYTGVTTITAGTLALSGVGSVATSSSVSVTGTLDISAVSSGASITTLSGAGGVNIAGKTITITNGSSTYSGVMTGAAGALTVSGGTQIFSGANDYSGTTTVSGGTLRLSSSGTTGAAGNNLTISSVGTLAMVGANLVVNNLSLATGGAITTPSGLSTLTANGTSSIAGTITTSGNQSYVGAVTLTADTTIASGAGNIAFGSAINGTTANTESLTLNAGTSGLITVAGAIGSTTSLKNLTVSNSGGTTFSGAVNVGTEVILTNTANAQTIAFNAGLRAPALTTTAGAYNLKIVGGTSTITNALTLLNTGYVQFGATSNDTFIAVNGLTATVQLGGIKLAGTISSGGVLELGASNVAITLLAATTLDTTNVASSGTTTTTIYTSDTSWVVPVGVSAISATLAGGQGGGSGGGLGGQVQATNVAVSAGSTLYIYVGGQGNSSSGTASGGSNGGGSATSSNSNLGYTIDVGSGGGASDVRLDGTALSNRILVAGAGGGSSGGYHASAGGNGGGLVGSDGIAALSGAGAGLGSTQSGGGSGGSGNGGASTGESGSLGLGGSTGYGYWGGGGGGGGYFGGGAGGSDSSLTNYFSRGGGGGGGGGSSYANSLVATGVTYTSGSQSGAGFVSISYLSSGTKAPSAIRLAGAVNGAFALTTKSGSESTTTAAIGQSTAVASYSSTGAGANVIGGSITTTGAQTYTGSVTLNSDALLTSSANGAINLSDIAGAYGLTISNGSGAIALGAVGATPLSSLTLQGTGSNAINGNIVTSGAVDLKGTSRTTGFAADRTITTSSGNGNVTLGVVDSAFGLTIAAGAGTINTVAIGSTTPLAFVTFTGTGINTVGGNITSTGAIDLSSTRTSNFLVDQRVRAGGALNIGTVNLASSATLTLDAGAYNIAVASITGPASGLNANVTFTNSGLVTVSGAIATRIGTVWLNKTSGNVSFLGSLQVTQLKMDATAAYNLSITGASNSIASFSTTTPFETSGTLTIGDEASDLLTYSGGALALSAPSSISLGGTVITSALTGGSITLGDVNTAINLGAGLTINTSASNANITIASSTAISGAGKSLTLNAGTGTISIASALSGMGNLSFTANEINWSAAIAGTGTLILKPTTMTNVINVGITSDAGTSTLDITAAELALLGNTFTGITFGGNTQSGNISIPNAITFNNSVSFETSASTVLAGNLIATGSAGISITGALLLSGADRSITSDGGAITLASIDSTGSGAGGSATQTITSTGNWTVPTGVSSVTLYALGGGGGGSGDAAGGGGGGGASIATISVSAGQIASITVGAGGSGTTTGTAGSGVNTTISLAGITVTGGGGRGAIGSTGGAGGIGSGGTINLTGGAGSNFAGGSSVNGSSGASSGAYGSAGGGGGMKDGGSSSNFTLGGASGGGIAGAGGNGAPQYPTGSYGVNGSNYGGGGGGGGNYSGWGGNGAAGVATISYSAVSTAYYALTISTNSGVITTGTVGASQALSSLTINAGGSSKLGGNVTTTGMQTYSNALTLNSNAVLTTINSNVVFASTIDSYSTTPRNLTVSAGTGNITFTGAVGGSQGLGNISLTSTGNTTFSNTVAATSLLQNSTSGTTAINGGSINTAGGAQTYNNNVTVGADAALTASTASFNGRVAGAYGLAITGNAVFGSTITNVIDLSVSGTTSIAANITTSGTQAYTGAVTLTGSGATRTLQGSTITASSTIAGGANALTITGNAVFGGVITGVTNLAISGTTSIGANTTTTGTQTYTGAVVLTGTPITLTTTNSTVLFSSTVNSAANVGNTASAANALTVSTGSGNVTFTGVVGGATNGALGALIINTTGTGTISAALTAASITTNA
ncbi:autotransporter-like protein, partial [Polynucleobacter brandtiae]